MRCLMVTNRYRSQVSPGGGAAVELQVAGLRKIGIDVDVFVVRRERQGLLAYGNLYRLLAREIDRTSPDVVHVQYGGIQAAISAKIAGRRCIVTYHGTDLHGRYGGLRWYGVGNAAIKFNVLASQYAVWRSGWSVMVSENLLKHAWCDHGRTSVIPTGVDDMHFRQIPRDEACARAKLDKNFQYVLFCDQNRTPSKRGDLARAAVEVAQRTIPSIRLHLLQGTSFDNIPFIINACSCVLMTSDIGAEGSPNIVKESLACNVPVISVDVGDVADRLTGIDGCHLCERDPEDLALGILAAVSANGRCQARETVLNQVGNDIVCRRIADVYRRIAAGGRWP